MADLATLGLAVDSSQVKTATAELDKLSTAAVKTGVSTAALEAGAKRLGISVEEYRKRVEGAVPATEQLGAAARAQAAAWAALQPVLSGVSGQLLALSAGAGPVGVFLSALGPWGIAASVGIGALSSAFNAMIEGANHIGDKSVEIKKFSDVTGLTVGQIKGLTSAGAALGVSSDQVTAAVERFSVGLDEAHKSTGPLFDKLREINPQLARQLSETRTTAQGWDILSQAIRDTTNEAQRNALLRAAFGRGGLEAGLVAISSANAGGLDAQAEKISKATGLTSQWVAETARLRNENIQLEKSITTMMESAYALPVLQRQNEFLRVQKEIAAAILATGRTPEGVRVGPTGEPEMSPTPDIPDIPQAPSVGVGGENARTSLREMNALTQARAEQLQATIRQNNLDKERIGILAGVIGQEEALALRLNELKAAMLEGKISAADFEPARQKVEQLRAAAAATTVEVKGLREAYGGVTDATAKILGVGDAQLAVAQSVTGAEKLVTQELATQLQLRLQNVPPQEASRIAAQQREIAEAQINSAVKEQILGLKDQVAVAGAVTEQEKISAQYVADRNKAIRDGVNPALAESLALEKANVAQAAEMANQQRQYAAEQEQNQKRAIQGINDEANAFARYAANRREANRQQDLWFQAHAQRGGYLGFGSEFANPDGTPKAYGIQDIQGIWRRAGQEGMNRFGEGGFDIRNQTVGGITFPNVNPNAQGLENAVTQMLLTGRSVQEAIDALLSGRLQRNFNQPMGQPLSSDAIDMIKRLMELVPENQRAATIQKEIEDAKKQPVSLAREELIKDLTDQLKQLTDATESLNATMDPLFTGGHEALRIGYYNEGGSAGAKYYGDTSGLPTVTGMPAGGSPNIVPAGGSPSIVPSGGWGGGPLVDANYLHAATGFEGVVGGHGGTDSTPIHIMATPGERIKLTPSGSNGASVTNIYQSINFPMSALGETRRSARQMAEGFRRAVN